MRPELASFRIDELLRQLELEFTPLAREKGLDLTFMPCSLGVRSDRRLLRRLLQNLVSNAVKYTPQGRVLVGCRRRNGRLRIDIFDTGLGIPKSKKRVIFREFQRLDEGAKVARGLGPRPVDRGAHRARARPSGGPAVGAGSRLALLGRGAGCDRRGRQASRARAASVDRGQLLGTVVLCIDNEPKILDGMEALLGGWGCRVLKAPDLAERRGRDRRRRKVSPNGLLIDYHLDKGNGIDAIAELRRRFGADLPAILITADRSPHVRDEARAHDVQVLNKPVKPAALRALMAQWRVQRVAAAE